MKVNTSLFYANLPLQGIDLTDLLSKEKLFTAVPSDWHIVITDIKDSTKAIMSGQHQTVNLLATGSIIAVLNIANKMNLDVPFFFGGDGATFIVPPSIIAQVMQALASFKINSLDNFGLEIRTGSVTVESVYKDGYQLRIAKHSRSSIFSMPIVLGNGLNQAEKRIKGPGHLAFEYLQQKGELDLSGMQCRWDRIAPPENQEEVISLLVIAREESCQSSAFSKVMQKINDTYGTPQQRQPICIAKLRLKTTFNSVKTEILAKFGRLRILKLLKAKLAGGLALVYLRTKSGKRYLEQLVEMSDTIVIDGKINTVISGKATQRKKLIDCLAQMESSGEIFYGLHSSSASVMSCYVRNMDDGHIHFVDGSEGGYTQASRILKDKLSVLTDPIIQKDFTNEKKIAGSLTEL